MSDNEVLDLSKYPQAIHPAYTMGRVNAPIELYSGPIKVDHNEGIAIPQASVTLMWQRVPLILCRFRTGEDNPLSGPVDELFSKPKRLLLSGLKCQTWGYIHQMQSAGPQHDVVLELRGQTVIGELRPATRVQLHLVNQKDLSDEPVSRDGGWEGAGRLRLESDDWQITIDRCPNGSEIEKELNERGGHALTHVAEVRRTDGQEFDVDELNGLLNALDSFLTFTTGSRCSMILPIGFDRDDREVWRLWREVSVRLWAPLHTWASDIPTGHVRGAFGGFMQRWNDPAWREPIELAVDWYVQGKHHGLETSLILGQSALELLAWVLFVEQGNLIQGADKFDTLWASDRIRLLLDRLSIPFEIPDRMTELKSAKDADGKTFVDGPHAITELRNAITHPKQKKRERFGREVHALRREAAGLLLFYIEQALLRLFGYRGLSSAYPTHGAYVR